MKFSTVTLDEMGKEAAIVAIAIVSGIEDGEDDGQAMEK